MDIGFDARQLDLARGKLTQEKFEHSIRVATWASRQGPKYATVGLLHEMFEDSDVDDAELRAVGVTGDELVAIHLLTHGPESYEDYVATIASSGDRLATSVKLCDLLDHLDPAFSRELDDAKVAKYLGALPSLIAAMRALP